MNKITNILGIAGSLRKGSYNRALLQNAADLVPEDARLEIFDLEDIPSYNQDLDKAVPDKIIQFKAKIKAANALLIVTPEYNYSVPGLLKNAIDWASRPPGDNAFPGKTAAIMSASTGMLGGARAQYHLRQSLVFLNVYAINKPEIMINFADQKFDEKGKLKDEKAKELIKLMFKALIELTRKLQTQPGN